jgi:phosphate transport system substrate-binding protein
VVYVDQKPDKGKGLVNFLTWIVHDGQKDAEPMHYAPLPAGLVEKIDEELKKVKTQ